MNCKISHYFKQTPVEGNALEQLKLTSTLEGMIEAVAMPYLHAGKGHPIGASFLTQGIVYPYLVGSDIGCGMALAQLDLKAHKAKRDKIVKRLGSLESPFEGEPTELEAQFKIKLDQFKSSLGTIGGSNHFLEIQSIESVVNQVIFDELNLDKSKIFVMAHTGSRGLGESILREHTDHFKSAGLKEHSPEFDQYFQKHNYALTWAEANRQVLLNKVSDALGEAHRVILDISHNFVEKTANGYLHRKGTAPADKGLVVIPGSRGDFSFLVKPFVNLESLNSLAHGAGRKWKRSESKDRLWDRYSPEDLLITDLKSQVICEDKDLLYEEAPENFKKISKVIEDLVYFKLIEVVAILRPVVTYKKKFDEERD